MGRADLLDLDLSILYRTAVDQLGRLLDRTLDENDRLARDSFSEFDHLLRNDLRFDLNESLDRSRLLSEDNEEHLGTCVCHSVSSEECRGKRKPYLELAKSVLWLGK